MSLGVGFDQAVITPSLDRPVYLVGFGQNRRAESIHDDLFACTLAVNNGTTTCVVQARASAPIAAALALVGLERFPVQVKHREQMVAYLDESLLEVCAVRLLQRGSRSTTRSIPGVEGQLRSQSLDPRGLALLSAAEC